MKYPAIGIRPVIDGRLGGVRESLEETTMQMARNVAAKIKVGHTGELPRFETGMKKSEFLIQHPEYNDLNKLPPEPLYYWYHALQF